MGRAATQFQPGQSGNPLGRPRGFANWKPCAATLETLLAVKRVLEEYAAYLPLTIRQIFYRLVATEVIEKTDQSYSRLCELMSRARRAQLIPMHALRDDRATVRSGFDFATEEELHSYLHDLAASARMDLQAGQPKRLELWCEAAGMIPQLTNVAHRYGVTVVSSGGFDSLTAKYDRAEYYANDGNTLVLHLGDYDPSGVHLFSSLAEDIQAFTTTLGGRVSFERLLVLPEHIDQYKLPTAPPKRSDNRSFNDTRTVQAEAFSPDQLAAIIEHAITTRLDMELYQAAVHYQDEVRAESAQRLAF